MFIHSPHDKEATTVDGIRFLSINRAVTGLASGCIDPAGTPSAMLFVGTQTNLLTYDVENNSDCFYKDVPDGVNSVAFGRVPSIEVRCPPHRHQSITSSPPHPASSMRGVKQSCSAPCSVSGTPCDGAGERTPCVCLCVRACVCVCVWGRGECCAFPPLSPPPSSPSLHPAHPSTSPVSTRQAPLVFVGGHCSVQGFDGEGNELYWTVTGDNVSAITFVDTNGDGHSELVVGSDDFEIRVFKDDDVLEEITETERVIDLCAMAPRGPRFGYALANGTVGVYNNTSRCVVLRCRGWWSCAVVGGGYVLS